MSPVKTRSAVVYTDEVESAAAGAALGKQVLDAMEGELPQALILFVSPRYEARVLVEAVQNACHPELLVGCSSAGEFTQAAQGEGLACAVALASPDLRFAACIAKNISDDRAAAAQHLVAGFLGVGGAGSEYASALILTDALAGHADDLLEHLTLFSGGNYQFFGGGAGDDARFSHTQVICGNEVCTNAVVALEILSKKPVGIGVRHGWHPLGSGMRVTEARGNCLVSLNAVTAVEVFAQHAVATNQHFDPSDPMPFFLHNILGIDTGEGYKLRVPLAANDDGSITCAAEIPEGAIVRIMITDSEAARNAAAEATRDALQKLDGHEPQVALFFDCVATRLRLGQSFGYELGAIQQVLGPIDYAGCNTYGQVARAEGQFSGFHNCTAVVCVIPS